MYNNPDVLWALAALVPLAVAGTAWSLQMSCGFCSVEPPDFWRAVVTVVVIAFVNVILRFILQMNDYGTGLGPQYVMPAMASAIVITIMLPTGPFTATTITIVQVILCALMYFAICWLCALVTLPFVI
jgi:hypothetical protein